MYKIIGGDGSEYGPVSADTLRQWFKDGRVNGETRVKQEGGDWATLFAFPDFADLTRSAPEPVPVLQMAETPSSPPPEVDPNSVFEGDYELDLSGCVSRGWNLVKKNFGVLFGGFAIYLAIQFAFGLLGAIPMIGPLFSLANWVVTGPLMGGLLYLFLKVIRSEAAGASDVFDGFKRAFAQLFLGQLVSGLLSALCLIPAAVAAAIILMPALLHHQRPNEAQLILVGAVTLLCVLPLIYLSISWIFTLPLIMDKQLDFWTAMKTSWRRVNVHWWQLFGLTVLIGLVNVAGVLACCVGVIFTAPVGFAALMIAYEIICSGRET